MSNSYLTVLDKLSSVIEGNKKYKIEDEINKNLLAEDARKYDSDLLNLLLKDASLKKHFFTETDAGLVFKKDVFLQFISNKEFLPDSYTKYANKIGLGTDDGSLLSGSKDIVLNWPYKDTVLEGGQDKEDQKRSEVFFNEVLAPDQITRLLDNKVFTNWKRYDKDGEHDLDELKDDDNLIIQGNNLIALHSLKKRYAGRVKLIYIDPPFNTGGDSFGYNDRFTHSTWLTFMKNRLEVARELLSEDGSIFIHCDENENAYIRVLCDEVFGRQNLMNEIIWRYRTYVGQVKDYFPKKHDTIFWYKKNARPQFDLIYEDNLEETVDYKRWSKFIVDGNKIRYGNHPTTDSRFTAYLKKFIKQNGQPEVGEVIYEVRGYIIDDVWEDIIALDPKNLSERTKFTGGQKPEALLERIIQSVTTEGDIVLDYHLGSGTTAAVSHKMKRRYIGIEQMGYIQDITMARLRSVIDGNQGGVSQSNDWQGGGSFIYASIMNNANKFRERVERAKSDDEYLKLLNEATSSSFLSYRVDPTKLNEVEFRKLSSADKRRLLLELIDNNTLYVNYEDIDDPSFNVSESDKKFSKELYK